LVRFSKPPHSAALPPLRDVLSTAHHRLLSSLAEQLLNNCSKTLPCSSALARVFGRFTTFFQTDLLTTSESPAKSGHSSPRSSPSRRPAKDAVATTALGNNGRAFRIDCIWVKLYANVSLASRAFLGMRASGTGFTPSNSAKDTLDVLKRCLAQVVLFGDGLERPARIHRPELTQSNFSNASRDVICPDFPIPFPC